MHGGCILHCLARDRFVEAKFLKAGKHGSSLVSAAARAERRRWLDFAVEISLHYRTSSSVFSAEV